ncbi:PriCT-2 domain-containing protein [Pseudoduganella sp. OTU4001]|uniref:PriCT-2 domain-containing protein n=1 Tax=Pseudoduganella sp. OTU4001 TaxID=3043854 RepID=UPI00406D27D0
MRPPGVRSANTCAGTRAPARRPCPPRGQVLPVESQRAIDTLHHITPPATRTEWINLGMAAKRAGVPFDEFHSWSRSGDGYESERQCQADWNAITEYDRRSWHRREIIPLRMP